MCHFCDEALKLLEQTRSGYSWVELSFPGGKPRLVTYEEDKQENAPKGIPDTVN